MRDTIITGAFPKKTIGYLQDKNDMIKSDDREIIISLIHKVAEGCKIENPERFDFYARNELIRLIRDKDMEIASCLSEFLGFSGPYKLIKHDQELKIKAKEIWEYQYQKMKTDIDKAKNNLIKILDARQIDACSIIETLSE